jgi:hypothetical protein
MTPEARAARERKQKIFVVVGGLLLLALLAFQLPKLLGGSSSPEAATTAGQTTLAGQATTPTIGAPIAATGAAPVAAVETAKITSFSLFAPKDPFVQQVKTNNAVDASVGGGAATDIAGKAGKVAEKAKEFATGKAAAAATIVTVNGARQVLAPGTKFPAADPMFVLVAENPGAKSVVVGIIGGAYSGGAKTTKLKIGNPLTLVNTTTGARYKISLVSVGSGDTSDKAAPATTP